MNSLRRHADLWPALLIAFISLPLLLFCWGAPFLAYDDPWHIFQNHLVMDSHVTLYDLFKTPQEPMYFPLTQLSYRLDHWLFGGCMDHWLGSWAPGVRLMNWIYHAGASLFLWRALLQLGLSRREALFAALVFAAHPTGCETLCWPSERKTVLAGLFSMATLWVYFRFDENRWRMPLVVLLYLCAVLSKPSALGLLPIFFLFELFGGKRGLMRSTGSDVAASAPGYSGTLLPSIARLLPLTALAVACIALNFAGKGGSGLIPPPGGTIFTAILTDFEILSRYLFALFLPVRLSVVYYVEPITSLFDARLMIHALLLFGLFAASLRLSVNRRRTLFGWGWFIGALGPNLNLIAMPHLMQDRYLYLAMPGVLLVLIDAARGISARLAARDKAAASRFRVRINAAGFCYIAVLLALATVRGSIFTNIYDLFMDAVEKQPRAAHARYCLAGACGEIMEIQSEKMRVMAAKGLADSPQYELERRLHEEKRRLFGESCMAFVDQCPDKVRQINYSEMALRAGEYNLEEGLSAEAERYFRISADGQPHLAVLPKIRSQALSNLAGLALRGNRTQKALALADEAIAADGENYHAHVKRAAALKQMADAERASGTREQAGKHLAEARSELSAVPKDSPQYPEALQLLKTLAALE